MNDTIANLILDQIKLKLEDKEAVFGFHDITLLDENEDGPELLISVGTGKKFYDVALKVRMA